METIIFDGYWLPGHMRAQVLAHASWETYYLKGGRVLETPEEGAVGVRRPRLDDKGWQALHAGLQQGRRLNTVDFLARWSKALDSGVEIMAGEILPFLPHLSAATGYSAQMVLRAFLSSNMFQMRSMDAPLHFNPDGRSVLDWQPLPGLQGSVRFFPRRRLERARLAFSAGRPFFRPAPPCDLALGFAAGNVPGTAFLISLLGGLANAADPARPAPGLLSRNSRHEPLFAPWVLSVLEKIDPEPFAATALLLWDYEDRARQADLMRRSGLMLAAAGDDTIAALDEIRLNAAPGLRFQRHGHKTSFSVIGRECAGEPERAGQAALDASLWDQNGCLSSRVHFVEGEAGAYAGMLAEAMRSLAQELPRGSTPRRFSHRAFDTFYALQEEGQVKVYSSYEDDFVVALDRRPWEGDALRRVVNACQGRTVIVRPVTSILAAAQLLRTIPAANLQTVGLACEPGRVLEFATQAGAAGVTAIRALGQAAFPQLSFSWDGYLPLDAAYTRPEGHWTGIEQ